MLDIHCHLLPQMDDGSDCVETANQILEQLDKQGVTQVAATPHFFATQDTPEDFLRRRQESFDRLSMVAGTPKILLGAEVTYFDGMGRCADLRKLAIGDTRLILVEMPFADWTQRMISEVVRIKTELGLQPVLAHVERYRGRKQLPKFLQILAEQGVAMQCNAQAFLTVNTRRWALSMAKNGYVQFLGTDAHNLSTRVPKYGQAVAVLEKSLPREIVTEMIGEIGEGGSL